MNIKELMKPFVGLIKKSPLPILENIVIGDGKIEGTDLETHVTVKAPLSINQVCVDYARFNKTIASLNEEYEIYTENGSVVIKTRNGKFSLPFLPVDDYPLPINDSEVISFDVNVEFIKSLKEAEKFSSKDELRAALRGINIVGSKEIKIYSSDAHRLYDGGGLPTDKEFSVIAPTSFARIIPLMSGTVIIGEQSITFENEYIRVQSRLIDDKYPNVEAVKPNQAPLDIAIFNAKELKSFVSQAIIYANGSNPALRFISDDTLKINAADIDFNTECLIDTGVKSKIKIGLSGKYLLDVLSVFPDDEDVTMSFWGSDRIVMFSNNSKKIYLMPILVQL